MAVAPTVVSAVLGVVVVAVEEAGSLVALADTVLAGEGKAVVVTITMVLHAVLALERREVKSDALSNVHITCFLNPHFFPASYLRKELSC